jgi:hypothetical protein
MATKKHTKSKAKTARGNDADKAVAAWRRWAPIRANLEAVESEDHPGPRGDKAWDRRCRQACDKDWDAGSAVLKAEATTVAGMAAKLHVALLLCNGFDHEAYIDAIRGMIEGVYDQLPSDMREKVTKTVKAMAARSAKERLIEAIIAMPDGPEGEKRLLLAEREFDRMLAARGAS